jgi:hypothetical protein
MRFKFQAASLGIMGYKYEVEDWFMRNYKKKVK